MCTVMPYGMVSYARQRSIPGAQQVGSRGRRRGLSMKRSCGCARIASRSWTTSRWILPTFTDRRANTVTAKRRLAAALQKKTLTPPPSPNSIPANRNIQPKIRQQLQELRDLGLLEFLGRDLYRLL